MGKDIKEKMKDMKHCLFVDRIKMKMLEYEGRNVIEVKENHTSMTCTSCGWQNKNLKASKIFECKKCPLVLERDIRGTEQ